MKGDSITLILDCDRQITKQLQREGSSKLATDGIILTGIQMAEEEGYFTVTILYIIQLERFLNFGVTIF